MEQADVNARVAWATLSSQSGEGATSQDITACFALLGSAFKTYSTALDNDDPLSEITTGESWKDLVNPFKSLHRINLGSFTVATKQLNR